MEEMIIAIVAIFFTIGVPVLAMATHFALRPLVRDLAQALGPQRRERETIARLAERIERLEGDHRERGELLDQLAEAELFRRQLEERAGGEAAGKLT
ncbi:MAG: hypothetical protein F4164_01660 [Gemmatimonadales bacterium]|nr:hypothetical protein [Gemmatimonadales bacterium]MYG48080.1 hypothetical protein [Gemmatimonadales bacterium]MYK01059.1 hypothetical protein [Candidatus Palauibacter ramosifaciens]